MLAAGLSPAISGYAATSGSGSVSHLTLVGTTTMRGAAARVQTADGTSNELGGMPELAIVKMDSLAHVPAPQAAQVNGNRVVAGELPSFGGFNGLNHRDQRTLGISLSAPQFSLEPPDQGLCVGNGQVLEPINAALRVFNPDGTAGSIVALNAFFGVAPAIVRSTPPVFGEFVSDPKCYFDPGAQRWFVTALQIHQDPNTGAFRPRTHTFIGVSQTADANGTFSVYSLDATDDGQGGTPSHTACPCFGDQPLIGADANGLYVSTNEYNLGDSTHPFGSVFNGAQIYAISKADLVNLVTAPKFVQINAGEVSLSGDGVANSVQPAASPAGHYESARGGTEYFLMSMDFSRVIIIPRHSTPVTSIALWALTNTGSLNSGAPNLHLNHVEIGSELYGQPPDAEQKSGDLFLGDIVHSPLSLVQANDDRMNQVVFADGKLWSAVNTAVQTENGPTRVGVAYFVVAPSVTNGLTGAIAGQGYVSVNQENLLFPSIGVTDAGKAVMTFSLLGPDIFPSQAYATLDVSTGVGSLHVGAPGQGPQDGFTGYRKIVGGNGDARWGDYSAAVADTSGTVWFAQEYIAHPATDTSTRTLNANWATFIGHVTP